MGSRREKRKTTEPFHMQQSENLGGELMLEYELGEDLDGWYELTAVVRSNRERVRRD